MAVVHKRISPLTVRGESKSPNYENCKEILSFPLVYTCAEDSLVKDQVVIIASTSCMEIIILQVASQGARIIYYINEKIVIYHSNYKNAPN